MSLKDNDSVELDEVKADHSGGSGVKAAEVEDATNVNAEDPKADGKKKKKAEAAMKTATKVDMKVEETDEDDEMVEEIAPATKAGMINTVLDEMKGLSKAELDAVYSNIVSAINEEDDDDDDEDIDDELDDDDKDGEKKSKKKNPFEKVKKEDLDLAADTAALFEGEADLSEDFIAKATTIFEATCVSKVNEKLQEVVDQNAEEMEEISEALVTEMAAKVDGYLEYVVEEWTKDNALAIESGIRSELTEDFIGGLKTLFEDHYIDVPEDKVDVLEEMGNRIADLEGQLDVQVNEAVELRSDKEVLQKDDILEEIADDMVDTAAEKLRSLAEGVDFENEDDYRNKLETLKENYFPTGDKVESDEDVSEDGINDGGDTPTGPMAGYVKAISKTNIT